MGLFVLDIYKVVQLSRLNNSETFSPYPSPQISCKSLSILPPPSPLTTTFFLTGVIYSGRFMQTESQNISIFCVSFLSLSIMFASFSHDVQILHVLLWMNKILLCRYTTFCLSIHELMDIGLSPPCGFMNNIDTIMNTCTQVFVWTYVLILLGIYLGV